MHILFGPAGSAGLGNEEGIRHSAELGLGCYEVEFTYGVRMGISEAKNIGELIKKNNLFASVHAPYYINLSSKEASKIKASKARILQSCERGHYLNAKYIVFHAGFYQGREPEEVHNIIKAEIEELQEEIDKRKWNVALAPETTGKSSQFGNLDELLRLRKETKCELCIDFAHIFARAGGKIDYDSVFEKIKHLPHLHCHFSGITYTQKGERAHIPVKKELFMPLAHAIHKHKPKLMTIINESPQIFEDAVLMKKWFEMIHPQNKVN